MKNSKTPLNFPNKTWRGNKNKNCLTKTEKKIKQPITQLFGAQNGMPC